MATQTVSKSENDGGKDKDQIIPVQAPLYTVSFLKFGRITVALPLFSLIFCYVTAVLFQFDQVNKTVCNIQNTIPSISAVTGIAPQRYVWRICIALHCTPRFIIAFVYWNYYLRKIHLVAEKHHKLFMRLLRLNFWLYTIENSCLVGVSYISNVENYPVHEKIFVVFMITALSYEFTTLILYRWTHPEPLSPEEAFSWKSKKICFAIIILSTMGLIFFFLRHRLYCEKGAFTLFSLSEYGIAITNIIFHYTGATDFRGMYWLAGLPLESPVIQHTGKAKTS